MNDATDDTYSFRQIGERVSNWGRWGPDDQKGTLNFITPAKVAAAAALVKRGAVFDLGTPFDENGPYSGQYGRVNPLHFMTFAGNGESEPGGLQYADDFIVMPLQSMTQWDALSHIWYDDLMYNGYPASSHMNERGAQKLSITEVCKGITGRGVLLDAARYFGVDWLQQRQQLGPTELEGMIELQGGVGVGEGDILILRTGYWEKFLAGGDKVDYLTASPGLTVECCEWLHERRVAVVASDTPAVEYIPPSGALEFHCVAIRDMGLTLGEIFSLAELAADCAADDVWEFFFAGPPLRVSRAVGSPVNPLAVK